MKNIALFCDGTNNQFSGDHTNVIRAYKSCIRSATQATFYDPGVGTQPQVGFTSQLGQRWSMILGLAFGRGFLENVQTAYRELVRSYEPGDRIYLFGFSRGAYTARAVAGMLHAVGLIPRGAENLVPYATNYWRRHRGPASPGGKLCAEFKATLAQECPVHFLGLWDTVGSVGYLNHFRTFPYTLRNPSVTHVRHAVSIDERRCCFRQNLMFRALERADQDIKNVWFAGVHADVGGGYAAEEAGLAKLAFDWVMAEAEACGLEVTAGPDSSFERELALGQGPTPVGTMHRSLRGLWWLLEPLPVKRYSFKDHESHWGFSLGRSRNLEESASQPIVSVHESVLQRMTDLPAYRPGNLPATPAAIRNLYRIEPGRTRRHREQPAGLRPVT